MNKFFAIFLSACLFSNCHAAKKHVAITQIVSHPALNAVRDNVIATVEKCQNSVGEIKISTRDANGNLTVAGQIAQYYLTERPDVIVAISTPSAQAMLNTIRDQIPIVFAAVTEPEQAKLINPKEPTKNKVTGVTDLPPFEQQLQFIQKILPQLKKLGIIYNAGEDNSRASVTLLQLVADKLNIQVIDVSVSKAADIPQTALPLAEQVDAIYIPNDNLLASSVESVIKAASSKKIPVFAADILLVERGTLGMQGVDYQDIGTQVGEMVCDILNGKSVYQIPVSNPDRLKTYLNRATAKDLEITIPKDLLETADKIFDKSKNH